MNYYKLALLGLDLKELTYESEFELNLFSLVQVKLKSKILTAVVLEKTTKPDFQTSEILQVLGGYFTPIQICLAKFIASYYTCEIGVAFGLFQPCVDLNKFDDKFDSKFNKTTKFEPKFNQIYSKQPNLSPIQNEALNFCKQNQISLLFGDTGSGKSEIYIEQIRQTLSNNKQALLLMPEISLTPQMQKRLEAYFGESVGIWHSKITPKKKQNLLQRFSKGEIRLIAGARSALFLPFSDLGIIVIDEEHDDSYKNNAQPYYNAKDLSIFIGTKFKIPVILGSATPSITSYHKFPHFRIKGTFFESQKEIIYDQTQTELSQNIINELKAVLERKKQAVVFLPTRANFKFLICKSCGKGVECENCSVCMSLHKKSNAMKCHYCGFMTKIPQICANCGCEMLEAKKIGTSELKSQLQAVFSGAKIAKFDKDEITTQKKLEILLKSFNKGEIDILVGTQMLSKGHDYHSVELAVIMGLDEHLFYSDFRARKKALALALQTAGRAGRAGFGKVIIQTMQREFFEKYLQNYDLFIQDELIHRNPLYPPFTRLLQILISDKNEQKAIKIQDDIISNIKNIKNLEIIGYGKAGIEFIASKFRRQILVRSNSHTPLIKASQIAKNLGGAADIDPLNFV
nr:primosomal protein N' [Campylobacter sp.]